MLRRPTLHGGRPSHCCSLEHLILQLYWLHSTTIGLRCSSWNPAQLFSQNEFPSLTEAIAIIDHQEAVQVPTKPTGSATLFDNLTSTVQTTRWRHSTPPRTSGHLRWRSRTRIRWWTRTRMTPSWPSLYYCSSASSFSDSHDINFETHLCATSNCRAPTPKPTSRCNSQLRLCWHLQWIRLSVSNPETLLGSLTRVLCFMTCDASLLSSVNTSTRFSHIEIMDEICLYITHCGTITSATDLCGWLTLSTVFVALSLCMNLISVS